MKLQNIYGCKCPKCGSMLKLKVVEEFVLEAQDFNLEERAET